MDQISYKLDVFEGPMDLLLSLIAKHKLNIYDIPIVELGDAELVCFFRESGIGVVLTEQDAVLSS